MATDHYEIRHCNRLVISDAWNYCPYCGTCLQCDSNLASREGPASGQVMRMVADCCDQRLDRNIRAEPITGVKQVIRLARAHLTELKEMES